MTYIIIAEGKGVRVTAEVELSSIRERLKRIRDAELGIKVRVFQANELNHNDIEALLGAIQ